MDQHEHLSTKPRTRVRVACDRCGVQQLPAAALTLRCCETDGSTSVRYACSRCGLVHVDAVTEEQASALAACDEVGFEAWALPTEAPMRPDAPAFRVDDLAEWVARLDDEHAIFESLDALADEANAEEADSA